MALMTPYINHVSQTPKNSSITLVITVLQNLYNILGLKEVTVTVRINLDTNFNNRFSLSFGLIPHNEHIRT